MSDELFDSEDEIVGGEETQSTARRTGFLPGIVIQVLKWVGIIIGAIIFIVTVVVITVNIMGNNGANQTRLPISEEYQSRPPILEWYQNIGELRGSTADEVRRTYIVEPHIGYELENRAVQTELIARNIQLIEMFHTYFSSRTVSELEGVENRERVKTELQERINNMMQEGKIRAVAFGQYQFIEF